MPSPFPGMDPYLENPIYWGGFHSRLYNAISTALNRTMPAGYFAEIEEYVWLQAEESDDRRLSGKPDAFVTARNGPNAPPRGAAPAAVGVAEPSAEVALAKSRKRKHRYVKVVAPDHRTVVTVVEVLSPSNKHPGPDRDKYLAKRDDLLAADTNLVEIDLLRDGGRCPMGRPAPPAADYYILVCRAADHPRASVWAFTVRDPVPAVPVPLKPEHPATPLPLQSLVTDIYNTNRYATRIDYSRPLEPALRPSDAEWAAALLETPARRTDQDSAP